MKSTASQHWGPDPPFTGEVQVTITNFFYGSPPDVDNAAKPILDALKGVVYSDDSQVSDLISRKRDLNGDPRIPSPSQVLIERLGDPKPFLHILVENAPN